MLTVWGRRSSSNVQAVMWCIEELEIPCQRIDAGLTYGVTDTDEYLSMNPNGTVPTIRDGGNKPLWESAAILRYLASRYADDQFWPSDPSSRANVDQWAEWSKINVALKFTSSIFWSLVRTPVERQDPQKINNAIAEFEKILLIADHQLQSNAYIAGQHFTMADIQFAHVLYRYYDISIERASLNCVADYYKRISDRRAFAEHVAVPYDELIDTM